MIETATRDPGPADVLLADGSIATVRAVGPGDGPALHELHDGVSDDAIRMRFFGVSRRAAHDYVEHVLTHPEHVALVAERGGRLLGLVTTEPLTPARSEVAFLVADGARGLGIGTLLLEHAAALSHARGVTTLEADVLAENHAMLSVLSDAGYPLSRAAAAGTVVLTLETSPTPETAVRADTREFESEARSLEPLLRPTSVAVVGVRRDGSGIGATVLRSVLVGGFAGQVVAVHPTATDLGGAPAVPALRELADPPDVVVVCVPAATAVAVVREAAEVGARAVVVVSSGFGEVGEHGATLQRELVAVARAHGVRLVGPNCLGLLCNRPGTRLNATFQRSVPPPGGLAVASQSGGVGIVLMDLARDLDLGIHTFVSLGNKADVSSNDLLAAWYVDDSVAAAALYLESFGNAAKFARLARRFSRRKPLLAVVGGRTAGGRRAGASHTAAVATPAAGVDALFAQAGVIGCRDAEDLARTALLLTEQPLPAGPRLGIVSNAGGMGVLAADAAAEEGLVVPAFGPGLQERLGRLVHGTLGTANPVDAGAGVAPDRLAAMVEAVLTSGEVDAVLVVPVATGLGDGAATMTELSRVRRARPGVPVVAVPLGGLPPAPPSDLPVTSLATVASAVRALGRAAQHAAWLAEDDGPPETTDAAVAVSARARARDLLGEASSRWLSGPEVTDLLGRHDLPVLGYVADTATEAVRCAARVGFPVAVKVVEADVVHRTERGLVLTGLTTRAQVWEAYRGLRAAVGHRPAVLVQPMVAGTEVALGLVRDPAMGPLVMVASGGTATEVWDDRTFLLPPVSRAEAGRAVGSLRVARLLAGYRGAPAGDVPGLERLVTALARLAVDVPEVAEVDLNPVVVGPGGCAVVDAKVRLAVPVGPDASAPRQLRPAR